MDVEARHVIIGIKVIEKRNKRNEMILLFPYNKLCINKDYALIESMAALMSSKMPSMVPMPLIAL